MRRFTGLARQHSTDLAALGHAIGPENEGMVFAQLAQLAQRQQARANWQAPRSPAERGMYLRADEGSLAATGSLEPNAP